MDKAHYIALAHRLTLAVLTHDEHSCNIIAAEIGDSAYDWRIVAEVIAAGAATCLRSYLGDDEATRVTECGWSRV